MDKLEYFNSLKHTTVAQDYAIEKKEYDKVLKKREKAMSDSLERIKNQPKTIWLNTLRKRIPVSEITESMMIAEEEFGEYLHNNN